MPEPRLPDFAFDEVETRALLALGNNAIRVEGVPIYIRCRYCFVPIFFEPGCLEQFGISRRHVCSDCGCPLWLGEDET